MPRDQCVAVIGGGPAGLMAAEHLASAGYAVTLYDRMASVGRKFLLAGRGGLNLTHSEPLEAFLTRYPQAPPLLLNAIRAFPPQHLRAWCEALGQPVFVGSSGRVFPAAMKASPLLRAWLQRLRNQGVTFMPRHRWMGWTKAGGSLVFERPDSTPVEHKPDATILALGGASWPRLGSDGAWTDVLARAGVAIAPLKPANCGFRADWGPDFAKRQGGAPLKRIALAFAGQTVRGEAVITQDGIEGGAIYALSGLLRDAIAAAGEATIAIDLRPDLAEAALAGRLAGRRIKETLSTALRKQAKLSPTAIDLLREAAARAGIRASGPATGGPRAADQGRAGPPDRGRPDRAQHLHRGRHRVRCPRRPLHAARASGRVRRRGNARLGGPDRRLSAAGKLRDRRRRSAGRD